MPVYPIAGTIVKTVIAGENNSGSPGKVILKNRISGKRVMNNRRGVQLL